MSTGLAILCLLAVGVNLYMAWRGHCQIKRLGVTAAGHQAQVMHYCALVIESAQPEHDPAATDMFRFGYASAQSDFAAVLHQIARGEVGLYDVNGDLRLHTKGGAAR